LGLALGYGKKAALKEEMQVGINAYSLYKGFNNVQIAKLTKEGLECMNLLVFKDKRR
jgi:hypothetical protein